MWKPLLLLLAPCLLVALPMPTDVVAKVNGEPILESDVRNYLTDHSTDRAEAIETLVLFRLAVQEARKAGFEKKPEVQKELDRALYAAYLKSTAQQSDSRLEPTEAEVKEYYQKFPLLRLRHLFLLSRTPEQQALADKQLKEVKAAIQANKPFEKIVAQYSQDKNLTTRGELNDRGRHNFPAELYRKVKDLKALAVSEPVFFQGAYHFFQLIEREPYAKASAPYLAFLRSSWTEDKTASLLRGKLESLRATAKVERLEKGNNP